MAEFFDTRTTYELVLWFIAVPATVVFGILLLLKIFGLGGHDGDVGAHEVPHHDFDGASDAGADHGFGFRPLTVTNFITFFAVFGWVGIAGLSSDFGTAWATVAAVAIGAAVMLFVAWLWYHFSKLGQSGSLIIHNAIGQVGTVYRPIPQGRGGAGEIQVIVQGSMRNLAAMTEAAERIPTGTRVKVSGILDEGTLLVEPM
jgi:membrane protein implicated in regulation of membrane protease activity